MGVVEAPIEHPNEHAFSMEGLDQPKPCVHAVHTRAVPCFVDVGNCTGSQFDGRHGELRQGIQVEGVHSERRNARPASAGIEGIGPRLPSRLVWLLSRPMNPTVALPPTMATGCPWAKSARDLASVWILVNAKSSFMES